MFTSPTILVVTCLKERTTASLSDCQTVVHRAVQKWDAATENSTLHVTRICEVITGGVRWATGDRGMPR